MPKWTIDRRTFLTTTGAAGAAALLPQIGARALQAGSEKLRWTPPSDSERLALVAEARFGRKQPVSSAKGVAICTHPLASAAAIDMLNLGGNACDAIMAASIAQAVVEPHMTTISGCLSMLYYDASSGEFSYVNGMMATPREHPFLKEPRFDQFAELARGGGLCFVPGFWGGFEAGHDRHGRLPRGLVMAPAIHYARHGFEVHPFLWGEVFIESAALGAVKASRDIYFRDNVLLGVGDRLTQAALADTLERLAEQGGDYFYRGEFGQRFAQAVQAKGGYVTSEDMAAYEAFWDTPVRGTYRGFELVGSPAPDFGGQALVEIMNMVELLNLQKMGPAFESPETTEKLMQIVGEVYADAIGGRFRGDLPSVERAISKEFASERLAGLRGPPKNPYENWDAVPPPGSNHVSVVDAEGNVATILHSVMSMPFTTGIFVDGVYACASGVHMGSGIPEPGGRAHARICPNMFVKDGKPVLASGSPSVSLTENIVQNSINLLDFGLDVETSVHKPRFGGSSMTRPGFLMVEADMGADIIDHLRANDFSMEVVNPWNWTHGSFDGIHISPDGTASACADPRRTAQAKAV